MVCTKCKGYGYLGTECQHGHKKVWVLKAQPTQQVATQPTWATQEWTVVQRRKSKGKDVMPSASTTPIDQCTTTEEAIPVPVASAVLQEEVSQRREEELVDKGRPSTSVLQ